MSLADIPARCRLGGHRELGTREAGGEVRVTLQVGGDGQAGEGT